MGGGDEGLPVAIYLMDNWNDYLKKIKKKTITKKMYNQSSQSQL